jgi:hypothetical protein
MCQTKQPDEYVLGPQHGQQPLVDGSTPKAARMPRLLPANSARRRNVSRWIFRIHIAQDEQPIALAA